MLQDVQDYDSAKAALERGEEELIPSAVVYAILDGENPIKVWREYAGYLNRKQLKNPGSVFHICHNWKPINAKVH